MEIAQRTRIAREQISILKQRAARGREVLQAQALEPNQRKERPLFSANRIAEMLGKGRQTLTKVIQDMKIAGSGQGAALRYEIDQDLLPQIRRRLGVQLERPGSDSLGNPLARVVTVVNQKGGVAKTTTALGLAQYAALAGLKVLAIDLDAQASFTTFMGITPDVEIKEAETAIHILEGSQKDLRPLVRQAPHFTNLHYIPACLDLAGANELSYHRQVVTKVDDDGNPYRFYAQMKEAIDRIRGEYDLIVLDTPPHISATGYNALYAGDVIIVPTGASMVDFASTLRFVDWIDEAFEQLPGMAFDRIRFLITNYDSKAASDEAVQIIRSILGSEVLTSVVPHSTEVQRAANEYKTIYELSRPLASREAWVRATTAMDQMAQEILSVVAESVAANRFTVKEKAA